MMQVPGTDGVPCTRMGQARQQLLSLCQGQSPPLAEKLYGRGNEHFVGEDGICLA